MLTSIFTTSYLSDIETPQCEFLNILCNNVDEKFKGELQKKFQTLPVPNVIDGLAAAGMFDFFEGRKLSSFCLLTI